MLRRFSLVAALVGLVALVPPAPSSEAHTATHVLVVSADIAVGSGAWDGAPGNGLCVAGFTAEPDGACVVDPGIALPFPVNGLLIDAPGGPLLGCAGAGGGSPVSCSVDLTGTVDYPVLGPTCSPFQFDSGAGPADTLTVDGTTGALTLESVSVHGQNVLAGTWTVAGHEHHVSGWGRFRPGSGGNCTTVSFTSGDFVGVLAVAPA